MCRIPCAAMAALLLILALSLPAAAAPERDPDDAYAAGYAAAVLEREFGLAPSLLRVERGVARIGAQGLGDLERARLRRALEAVPGLHGVVFVDEDLRTSPGAVAAGDDGRLGAEAEPGETSHFLPPSTLFDALEADPRWPHFSASYQFYVDHDELRHVGDTSFGETFVIFRDLEEEGWRWELAIQAGVFAVFDLAAESMDLVNADYRIGFPLFVRNDNLSAMLRLYHQSSHVGDEFLLRGRTDERVNLSYEALDAVLSYDLGQAWRVYGGGGYLLSRDPADVEPGFVQWGLEYRSPVKYWDGYLRPVAGVHLENREETDWDLDVSAVAGVQVEPPKAETSRRVQVLMEYYHGHSPNGQFYEEIIHSLGLGLHFYY
jgi:hypothetical protein